jgi:hypothetical protein
LVGFDIKKLKQSKSAYFKSDKLKQWFIDNTVTNPNGDIKLKVKTHSTVKLIPVYEMDELSPLMSCFYFITQELKVSPLRLEFDLLTKIIQEYLGISLTKAKIYATTMIILPGEVFKIIGGKKDGK